MSNNSSYPIVFSLYTESKQEWNSLRCIVEFIKTVFDELGIYFGEDELHIINIPEEAAPQYINRKKLKSDFDVVMLNCAGEGYWSQIMYQVSHELTHAVIHRYNPNDRLMVKWIEESICELVSWYCLSALSSRWRECELSRENETYFRSVERYLQDILNLEGTSKLSHCASYGELMEMNRTSEEQREDRQNEVREMYVSLNAKYIKGLIHYRDFVDPENHLVDSSRYMKMYLDNPLVSMICFWQDHAAKGIELSKIESEDAG